MKHGYLRKKFSPVLHNVVLFFIFFFPIYLFMIERERGRDTGRGRSRLHAPGARCGIRSQVSRIAPWAKGRRQTAAPPRDPRFHTNLKIICSNSLKKAHGILIGIPLNMYIALGSIDIFTILILPIHEHGMFFSNSLHLPQFLS